MFLLYRFVLPDKIEDYKNIFKVYVKDIENTLNKNLVNKSVENAMVENADDKNVENTLVEIADNDEIKTLSVNPLNENIDDKSLNTLLIKNDSNENELSDQESEIDASAKGEGSFLINLYNYELNNIFVARLFKLQLYSLFLHYNCL